jgi:hypothetical protein
MYLFHRDSGGIYCHIEGLKRHTWAVTQKTHEAAGFLIGPCYQ